MNENMGSAPIEQTIKRIERALSRISAVANEAEVHTERHQRLRKDVSVQMEEITALIADLETVERYK